MVHELIDLEDLAFTAYSLATLHRLTDNTTDCVQVILGLLTSYLGEGDVPLS
jgi:hypothetical protein